MNSKQTPAVPRVFISSTAEDLRVFREAAKEAAIGVEMLPKMMEYFVASGDKPPLEKCLAEVSGTDLLVVIVGQRYGWIPPDPPAGAQKSITWLECEQAIADGHEVLAFLVDEKQPWPSELSEGYRLTSAMQNGTATNELFEQVNRNVAELKPWLNERGIRALFANAEQLRRQVSEALHDWRKRHPQFAATGTVSRATANPETYLRWLLAQTSYIDIRGLYVSTGQAHRFPIADLFITLTTTSANCRAAICNWVHPQNRGDDVGFRVLVCRQNSP